MPTSSPNSSFPFMISKYSKCSNYTISSSISEDIEGSTFTIDCSGSCFTVNPSSKVGTNGGKVMGFKGGGPLLTGFAGGKVRVTDGGSIAIAADAV